jgi:hypothetical protein
MLTRGMQRTRGATPEGLEIAARAVRSEFLQNIDSPRIPARIEITPSTSGKIEYATTCMIMPGVSPHCCFIAWSFENACGRLFARAKPLRLMRLRTCSTNPNRRKYASSAVLRLDSEVLRHAIRTDHRCTDTNKFCSRDRLECSPFLPSRRGSLGPLRIRRFERRSWSRSLQKRGES